VADPVSPSARRVRDRLRELGFDVEVLELPGGTRTAADAARAVGGRVEQIAKSLVFRGRETGRPLLAIVGGANRLDERRLGALAGEPVGHREPLVTFIDEGLLRHEEIWAAGTPNAVFRLPARDLPALTGGRVVAIV
jgi:prolyl-tRNA editing enzyme YbaK/EbsC (Cys-tRNA(Pro) deacylase)